VLVPPFSLFRALWEVSQYAFLAASMTGASGRGFAAAGSQPRQGATRAFQIARLPPPSLPQTHTLLSLCALARECYIHALLFGCFLRSLQLLCLSPQCT
jgi:hypothetical protein